MAEEIQNKLIQKSTSFLPQHCQNQVMFEERVLASNSNFLCIIEGVDSVVL